MCLENYSITNAQFKENKARRPSAPAEREYLPTEDLISALAGSEIRSAVEAVHLWVNTVFQAIILIGHSCQNLCFFVAELCTVRSVYYISRYGSQSVIRMFASCNQKWYAYHFFWYIPLLGSSAEKRRTLGEPPPKRLFRA